MYTKSIKWLSLNYLMKPNKMMSFGMDINFKLDTIDHF